MTSEPLVSAVISAAIIATAVVALFSTRVSVSLIFLFYSSMLLGIAFTVYGDALVGLMQIVTFSGAVSVLFLTVILMTGESRLRIGAGPTTIAAATGGVVVVAVVLTRLVAAGGGAPPSSYPDVSMQTFAFLWEYRPWDLLVLVTVFAAAMVTVANLFSREPS